MIVLLPINLYIVLNKIPIYFFFLCDTCVSLIKQLLIVLSTRGFSRLVCSWSREITGLKVHRCMT